MADDADIAQQAQQEEIEKAEGDEAIAAAIERQRQNREMYGQNASNVIG